MTKVALVRVFTEISVREADNVRTCDDGYSENQSRHLRVEDFFLGYTSEASLE